MNFREGCSQKKGRKKKEKTGPNLAVIESALVQGELGVREILATLVAHKAGLVKAHLGIQHHIFLLHSH